MPELIALLTFSFIGWLLIILLIVVILKVAGVF